MSRAWGMEDSIEHSEVRSPAASLRTTALWFAVALVLAALFAAPGLGGLPTHYWVTQDRYVLSLCVATATAFGFGNLLPRAGLPLSGLDRRHVLAIAAALALLLWAGTYLIMRNYPLTRDEHMVLFDMAILREGRLAAPLAPEWRPYILALTPDFLLRLPGDAAWVSAYMPVNAMLRAAFAALFDPALMNPLLAAVGAVALHDIARHLFPGRSDAPAVALLLYVTSAQVLATAMTSYAMTGHLALNLLWLALFLRDTRASHAGAIAVGFLAIGLHQVVFHPLFALPFLDLLRQRGQWRTLAAYVGCYAAFGLFWISYPALVAMSAGLHAAAGGSTGSSGFISERVMPLLLNSQPTLPLMNLNLIRIVTWQNLALIPFVLLGLSAVRRDVGIAKPLCYGIVLTLLAMALLLPYQGHGWGYRYLHGLIGSAVLLAAYGWREVADRDHARAFLAAGTAATIFLSAPFLLWCAHQSQRPVAEVNRLIDRIDADVVIVDVGAVPFAMDLVRNHPDLGNRPIRLSSHHLQPGNIALLCARGSVAFASRAWIQQFAPGTADGASLKPFRELHDSVRNRSCYRQL